MGGVLLDVEDDFREVREIEIREKKKGLIDKIAKLGNLSTPRGIYFAQKDIEFGIVNLERVGMNMGEIRRLYDTTLTRTGLRPKFEAYTTKPSN